MAINEQIVTGRKFRRLKNEETKLWERLSIWKKAVDVEFNDGKNAEHYANSGSNMKILKSGMTKTYMR